MIINIIKNHQWIDELELFNKVIKEVSSKYHFPTSWKTLKQNEASRWFNPDRYNWAPLSRTYPFVAKEQMRPEYKLIENLPNYVTMFLIKELYADRKNILIEDFGCGMGRLLFFLSKLGFTNFHAIEIFKQLPQQLFIDLMEAGNITYALNDLSLNPVIVNNCNAPFTFITHGLKDATRNLSNVELICFYAKKTWETQAPKRLGPLGYKFLCKDSDAMTVAWCRNDKLKEFTEKLKQYEF